MKKYFLPIQFGVATSVCLIMYFLILSLFNLHTIIYYSLFNAVITAFGIYQAIKFYRLKNVDGFNYGEGFIVGMIAGSVATGIFTFFFALYATELNATFLEELSTIWFDAYSSFEAIVFFTIGIMGLATTLVLTLAFMQLFKASNNLKEKRV